jgi:hypothetical protein
MTTIVISGEDMKIIYNTDKNYPNSLFYNSKKLWRNIGSIVNTIVHEYVHSVDGSSGVDFGHGSQSSAGKNNFAPYWIGNKVEMFYETENSEAPVVESISIDPQNIIGGIRK